MVEVQLGRLEEEVREAMLVSNFEELPPAGVLPRPFDQSPDQYFRSLFGNSADLEVVQVQADCALRALEQTQHLDRIPVGAETTPQPYVQLLVPMAARTDLKYVKPQGEYPWMVFVRACGRPKVDEVPVYVVDAEDGPGEGNLGRGRNAPAEQSGIETWLRETGAALGDPTAVLTYPVDSWARPRSGDQFDKIQNAIHLKRDYWVFGNAAEYPEPRVALMSVRSGLLAVDVLRADQLDHVVLHAFQVPVAPEAIFVVGIPHSR